MFAPAPIHPRSARAATTVALVLVALLGLLLGVLLVVVIVRELWVFLPLVLSFVVAVALVLRTRPERYPQVLADPDDPQAD